MATGTNEIDDIRRQMARIRRELHEDVRGVVESAEAVSDWKHYIRQYPWAAIGAALAVGYFVVPKRKKKALTVDEVAKVVAIEAPRALAPRAVEAEPKKKGRGLIGAGLGMLAPVLMRAAQNYATHYLTTWIAQQQQAQMDSMMSAAGMSPQPAPGAGPMPGGPGRQMPGGTR